MNFYNTARATSPRSSFPFHRFSFTLCFSNSNPFIRHAVLHLFFFVVSNLFSSLGYPKLLLVVFIPSFFQHSPWTAITALVRVIPMALLKYNLWGREFDKPDKDAQFELRRNDLFKVKWIKFIFYFL